MAGSLGRVWQKYKGLGGVLFQGSWAWGVSSFPGDFDTHLAVVPALEDTLVLKWSLHLEGSGGAFHVK